MGALMSTTGPVQQGFYIRGHSEFHAPVSVNSCNCSSQCTESAIHKNRPFHYNYPDFPQKRYVGHSDHLQRLKDWFNQDPGAEENFLSFHTMVVCGMAGAGKTTLIHRFIQVNLGNSENDISIIWLPAGTEDVLETHFRTLATMLQFNTEQAYQKDLYLILQHVYSSLHDQKTLLVFDNAVDDISDVNSKRKVSKYFPKLIRRSNFKIIVTSRNQDWQDVTSNVCRMETLLPSEAIDYIEYSLTELPDVKLKGKDVAEYFDYLPIAIESAVGAILYRQKREQALGSKYSLESFLQALKKSAKQGRVYKSQEIKRTERGLDVLWNNTLDMLAKDSKNGELAIKILNYLAFLSPNGVPLNLITKMFDAQKISRENLGEALLLLKSLSLVTTYETKQRIKVHRLLQSVLIKELKKKKNLVQTFKNFLQMYLRTLNMLKDNLNDVAYSDNARAVCENFTIQLTSSKNHPSKIAIVGIKYVLVILEQLLNFNSDYVLQVINDILVTPVQLDPKNRLKLEYIRFSANNNVGNYQEVLAVYERYLIVASVAKSSHKITWTLKINMAVVLCKMRRYEDARKAIQEVLQVQSDILGRKHLDTLMTKSMMAMVLHKMGKSKIALKIYQRVLKELSDTQGSNHLFTWTTKYDIGSVLGNMGKYGHALKIYEEVLKTTIDISGSNHPDTLTIKKQMATICCRLGDYEDALNLIQEVLEVQSDIQGSKHRSTLHTKNEMAMILNQLGKCEDARKLYQEILNAWSDIQASSHSSALNIKDNMIFVLSQMGNYEDALKLCEEVLQIRSEMRDSKHPETVTTKNNMAFILDKMGKYEDALKLFEDVLKIRSQILGSKHPDTLITMQGMASVLCHMGKHKNALRVYQEVLQIQSDIHGSDHPCTVNTKALMVMILILNGELEDGLTLWLEVQKKFSEDLRRLLSVPLIANYNFASFLENVVKIVDFTIPFCELLHGFLFGPKIENLDLALDLD